MRLVQNHIEGEAILEIFKSSLQAIKETRLEQLKLFDILKKC